MIKALSRLIITILLLAIAYPAYAQQSYDGPIRFEYPDDWMVTEGEGSINVGNVPDAADLQPGQISIIIGSPSISDYLADPNPIVMPDTDDPLILNAYVLGYLSGLYLLLSGFQGEPTPLGILQAPERIEIGGHEAAVSVYHGQQEGHLFVVIFDEPVSVVASTWPSEWKDWEPDVLALIESIE